MFNLVLQNVQSAEQKCSIACKYTAFLFIAVNKFHWCLFVEKVDSLRVNLFYKKTVEKFFCILFLGVLLADG